jgi:hypothetical protein
VVEHAVGTQLGAVLTLATDRKIQVAAGETALEVGAPVAISSSRLAIFQIGA